MDAPKIVRYYRSRFQIEFAYRDANQHYGLTHCQARSENKLHFHFNAALTAVNWVKTEWLQGNPRANQSFSMQSHKTMYENVLKSNIFIRKFGINPNTKKNKQIIKRLRNYGWIVPWNRKFITNYCTCTKTMEHLTMLKIFFQHVKRLLLKYQGQSFSNDYEIGRASCRERV